MTRDFKILVICNMATLAVAMIACYFAFDARKQARAAAFAAEWASDGSGRELSEIKQTLTDMAEGVAYLSDRAKEEDNAKLPIIYQR